MRIHMWTWLLLLTGALLVVPTLGAKEISLEDFTLEEGTSEETATHIPWSGIWWPMSGGKLATGWNGTRSFRYDGSAKKYVLESGVSDADASSLLKYDRFVERRYGTNPGSALAELHGDESIDFRHHIYGDEKDRLDSEGVNYSWWGHCNGWAAAAVMEKEPLSTIVAEGIPFEVADQKGLLTEVYFGTTADFTGTRYNAPSDKLKDGKTKGRQLLEALDGNDPKPIGEYVQWYEGLWNTDLGDDAETRYKPANFRGVLEYYRDWYKERYEDSYADVAPDTFHKILVSVIKIQGRAVVFDTSADEQVWNFPAYRYTATVTRNGNHTENGQQLRRYRVQTTVVYAHDGVSESVLGVVPLEMDYTYDLYTDDANKIVGGKWTGQSVDDHPDFAWMPTYNPTGRDTEENPKTEYGKVLALLADDHKTADDDQLTLVVTGADGTAVSSADRVDTDGTTTWTNPIAVGSTATISATGAVRTAATRVVLSIQPVHELWGGKLEATREAKTELAVLTAAGGWTASVEFPETGKLFIVGQAYNAQGKLVSIDEVTVEVSGAPTPTGDDSYEENDTRTQATSLSAGTYTDLVCNDDDWYKITLSANQSLEVRIAFSHSTGDLDMKLQSASGSQVDSSTSTANSETVETSGAGVYYVRVYGYSGAKAPYTLEVTTAGGTTPDPDPQPTGDDSFEENDTRSAAAAIAAGTHDGLHAGDEDWYKVELSAGQSITVRIEFSHADGDLDLYLYGSASSHVGRSWSTSDNEEITYTATTAGTYYIKVHGYDGAIADYRMILRN